MSRIVHSAHSRHLACRPAIVMWLAWVGAFIGVSSLAVAEGPGWTAVSTITKLVDTQDGGVNVQLSPSLSACVSNSGYGATYASVYPNHPGLSRIKATLLTAFVTGTPVSLYFSANTGTCQ